MPFSVGLSGAARHASVALHDGESVVAVCEQERVTRQRAAGANPSGLPDEALDEVLRCRGSARADVSRYALAEPAMRAVTVQGAEVVRLAHHFSHACTSYLSSPFESAAVVVCDHEAPQVSVWTAKGPFVSQVDWPWEGPGFAALYSACSRALAFDGDIDVHRFEALARLMPHARDERTTSWFRYAGDHLSIQPQWERRARALTLAAPRGGLEGAFLAAVLQARVGELLLEFLSDVRRRLSSTALCLGGSLFYNSYLNSTVKTSGLFERVFVPVDPGNAGLSVGAAMWAGQKAPRLLSPFLGPSFTQDEIKETLDNCKLAYEWMNDTSLVERATDALRKGRLVGWFDGPMEWGRRAVGARSILASPLGPFVLQNLNHFLKQREPWRGYALSCPSESVPTLFEGPDASPFMECDYQPKDPTQMGPVLPAPGAALRIHSVGADSMPRFRRLLHAFGAATGIPLLVNTSFNGFREPIVCTPRDAVRVFFGTGIDMLVLDRFVLTK